MKLGLPDHGQRPSFIKDKKPTAGARSRVSFLTRGQGLSRYHDSDPKLEAAAADEEPKDAIDQPVPAHINRLVADEHHLYNQQELTEDDRSHLSKVKVEPDQRWDLLRQRQAPREFGRDPEELVFVRRISLSASKGDPVSSTGSQRLFSRR